MDFLVGVVIGLLALAALIIGLVISFVYVDLLLILAFVACIAGIYKLTRRPRYES